MMKPFGFIDYMKLQIDAWCVISDSGTIFEECALWGFPAVTIRDSIERLEGIDEGVLIVCSWDLDQIYSAVNTVRYFENRCSSDYFSGNIAQKVVSIISSYIHQIRKKVYFK